MSKKLTLIPPLLCEIPDPPAQLFTEGRNLSELIMQPRIAIVGSRRPTAYGRQVTHDLASQLAEQGIVIISGLALGIDAIAHRAALSVGGSTLAVLPSPLNNILPATNRNLATEIIQKGGALVTEYANDSQVNRYNFIARNRLVSGLADAVLITEAAENSGTLHTAEFALDQGRDVLAIPGNITSQYSAGTNNLIKIGAAPVTSCIDILRALGIEALGEKKPVKGANEHEQLILDLLTSGISEGQELLHTSKLSVQLFNQSLTMLEITGKIRSLGSDHWATC